MLYLEDYLESKSFCFSLTIIVESPLRLPVGTIEKLIVYREI